jgi:hypothetical protein
VHSKRWLTHLQRIVRKENCCRASVTRWVQDSWCETRQEIIIYLTLL